MAVKFSISDLASEFDITTRTLRFYEEKGLLNPKREGQTRVYSQADRTRLKLVLRGKRLGLSLDESARIIGMYDPETHNRQQLETLLAAIDERQQQLRMQLIELNAMLDDLDEVREKTLIALTSHPQKIKHSA
jgi:DNA-binding transcriptional MerR regulator